MALIEPVKFGKYLLLDRIGIGGMAEVFKAKLFGAEGFERLVAIKRILPHLVEDDEFVKMFVDEAKIAVRLNHPNIVSIHDLGKADGTLFIGMEYVLGKDLRALYDCENERRTRTPVGIAAHIVMKMCEALHHAHFATGPRGESLNVIHRDVSPQNVLVSFDGEVKVADFGLAKARGRMVQTQAGVVKGKLAYMSPEQLRGEEIDHRVDVFGLGIVLFELLTGRRLFLGPSDMDTLRKVYEAKVPEMRSLAPNVQPQLEQIVRRALAKDRDERYPTALELHDDLQRYVYTSGDYCGTSALRKYIAEAFPDSAPELPVLPPFAEQVAAAEPPPAPRESKPPVQRSFPPPRPTLRPPGLSKHLNVDPLMVDEPLGQPVTSTDAKPFLDDAFEDATSSDAFLDLDTDQLSAQAVDTRETERPASDAAVRLDSVSGAGDGLPSLPVGIYEEPTARGGKQAGPPVPPAPRIDELAPKAASSPPLDADGFPMFDGGEWIDDEPTQMGAMPEPGSRKRPAAGVEADPDDVDDLWDDEATVVVDPRSS